MIYAFESYELDTERRSVSRERRTIALSPQSYKLLLYLVERAGRTVAKSELGATLWDGCPDYERRLRQEMFTLRRALGLRSRNDVIATVASCGYKLVASMTLRTRGTSSRFIHSEALRRFADGMAQMQRQDRASVESAYRSFEEAAQIDSCFAAAYLGMAQAKLRLAANLWLQASATVEHIDSLIAEALRLDPAYIEAELLRWEVAMWAGNDLASAAARLQQLAAAHPDNAALHHALAWAKLLQLDSAGAVEETIKASACDPTDLQLHCAVATASFYDGNFAQAYAELELVSRLQPWRSASRGSLGAVLVFLGKPAEALTLLRAAELRGSQSAQATLCWALVKTGDRASAQRVLDRLTSNGNGFISQYCRSRCLVALEHETEALQALDSAEGEFQLRLLALDPWFASLRTDARFEAIVRKHAISEVVSKI